METKICVKCGMELPKTNKYFNIVKVNKDGFRSFCKKCESEYKKQYRKKNKEIIYKQKKQYYKENKEIIDKYMKQYYKKYHKKYYESHKESMYKYMKQYRETHKQEMKIFIQRRKSKEHQLPSTLTLKQWNQIKDYFNNRCAYCGQEKPLAQEHFIPLSKGGEYTINNIIPSCKSCNSHKSTKDFFNWYPKYKYYSKEREKTILDFLGYKGNQQQLSLIT